MLRNDVLHFIGRAAYVLLSPLAIVSVIAAGEVALITRFAVKRGRTVYRSNERSLLPAAGLVAAVSVAMILVLRSDTDAISAAITMIAFSAPILPYALRYTFLGLYEHLVVGKDYICRWQSIERIETDVEVLRLTHRSKGATEYRMSPSELEAVCSAVARLAQVKPRREEPNRHEEDKV